MEEIIHKTIEPRLNKIIDNEHYSIMGHFADQIYFYSHRTGEFLSCGTTDVSKGIIRRLAPADFWQSFCPDDKLSPSAITEIASEMLCRASEVKGIFDVRKIRGCGTWMDKNIPILHLGTKILRNGEYINVKDFKSNYVYPIKHDLMVKNGESLSKEECQKLINLCNKLSWEDEKSGMLLAGWLFMAPLCGALHWRSHLYILGGPGTGKSYIMSTLIPKVLGEFPLKIQGSSTEAGIRQYLDNDARPIIFDEAEAKDQQAKFRLQSILSLARQASTPDSAPIIKGSADGHKANIYFLRSVFAMSSIELPIIDEADKQRFTILRLKPFPHNQNLEKFRDIQNYSKFLNEEYSAGLLAKGMENLTRIRLNQEIFMEAGESVFGKRRVADQMSMMLTGAYCMTNEGFITYDEAIAWMNKYNWDEQKEIAVSSHDIDLLNYILDYVQNFMIDVGGQLNRSIREIIDIAVNGKPYREGGRLAQDEAIKILKRYGFRITDKYLEIANKSDFLKKILRDTQWNYPCFESLGRIKDVVKCNDKISRFGDFVSKFTAIPLRMVLENVQEHISYEEEI